MMTTVFHIKDFSGVSVFDALVVCLCMKWCIDSDHLLLNDGGGCFCVVPRG